MTTTSLTGELTGALTTGRQVRSRAAGENFPVASRLLPARYRADLLVLYRYARSVDDLGDEYPERSASERLAALDAVAAEVAALPARGALPFVAALCDAVAGGLPTGPLLALVEANRMDQQVVAYRTWEELLGYCRLSAEPVGQLVLHVFGAATADRLPLSDAVCTALQVVEHLQDVAEDYRRGRRYLPADVLAEAGLTEAGLAADIADGHAGERLRAVVQELAWRARGLLAQGGILAGTLHGAPKLAVAGFTGGGLAVLDALAAGGYDVLGRPARPRPTRTLLRTLAVALGAPAVRPPARGSAEGASR